MALVVPRFRVYDDTESIPHPLALALQKRPEPQFTVFWDLLPFRSPIRQLTYEIASRSITAREVVLQNAILTSDTDIDLDSTTKTRISIGTPLFHPATKQIFIMGDDYSTTTGTGTIRSVVQRPGGSRTQVNAGLTLYALATSEHFDKVLGESRVEATSKITNYIQDTTEVLSWGLADLKEARRWGVDKQMRLNERMRDIMKDLNKAVMYNAPLAAASGVSSMTCGFDYAVENNGLVVDADTSGTANLADIRGVLKTLVQNGAGPADGIAVHMSSSAYFAYEEAGLQDFNLQLSAEEAVFVGNSVKGISIAGLGPVPFYPDATVVDDRVRVLATAHAGKAYYQGVGEGATLESPHVEPEPNQTTSKVEVTSWQQKWGTVWENTDKVHAILDNTGL